MPTFKLITEPWIPAATNGPPIEMSLREVFERAHEIRSISDPSPLSTAGIYRLLIAIAQRVLPSDDESWEDLWAARDIRVAEILAYLEKHRQRFDLFDPEWPFYQVAGLDPGRANTAAKLCHDRNAGANPALFDHSLDDEPVALRPAEAARALLALQCFAPGGLLAFEVGKTQDKSANAAPLTKCAVVVATGGTLAETLLLNLFHRDPGREPGDLPAWERLEPTRPMDRMPDGPLDLLTWQARRVLLIPSGEGDNVVVERAVIMKGYQFPGAFVPALNEPMVAFKKNPRAAAKQDPFPPIGFRPGSVLWRDSMAFVNTAIPADDGLAGRQSPKTLRDLANRRPGDARVNVNVYGLGVDRAKLLLWRHEQFPLPLVYLDRASPDSVRMRDGLDKGIEYAEEVGLVLRRSVTRLAIEALSPEGNPDPKRVRQLSDSLDPSPGYWGALDAHFRIFMSDLAEQWESNEARAVRLTWRDAVDQSVRRAFDRATSVVEGNGRGFRAAAEARGSFSAQLAKVSDDYRKELPEEEYD